MMMQASDKTAFRLACKNRRDALSETERNAYSQQIERFFLENISVENKVVAGYFPIRHELDVLPLLNNLRKQHIFCCLPVIDPSSKVLRFREWKGKTIAGTYGIQVPPLEERILTPDIILVPLLGFTKSLHRIGYGAGYYDATLRHLRSASHPPLAIGIAFSLQQVDFTADPHDEPLDRIITEQGMLS